ncbi:tetraspanin-8-like isoform X2 [Sardina pilchardus]|uniref:tetraspanin-8-like isoform X2 n=1 Tax=Sardina pilchardus TaxID=27697 RepID=UPI002E147A99
MGHVNLCLKGLFIGFNTLFGMIGILLIVLGRTASTMAAGEGQSDIWQIYLLGGAIAAISCLGVFGARKQITCALKMFSGLVCIGMVICVIAGMSLASNRSMIIEATQELLKEEVNQLEDFQAAYKLECCGINKSYTDWGPEIPDSCVCAPVHQDTAICYQEETNISERVQVYKEKTIVFLKTQSPSSITTSTCGVAVFAKEK